MHLLILYFIVAPFIAMATDAPSCFMIDLGAMPPTAVTNPTAVLINPDGEVANVALASVPQVYVPRLPDIVDGRIQIRDEMYYVDQLMEDYYEVPAACRAMCTSGLRPLDTNNDGACGVHFAFGFPPDVPGRELTASAPRQLAADLLGPSLAVLIAADVPAMCVESVQNMLWNEYALKHLSGKDDDESRCFWQMLEKELPELAMEARYVRDAYLASLANCDDAKRDMLDAARDFFNLNIEEDLVRPLAVTLGHVPANVDVLRYSSEEVTALRSQTHGEFDFLETPQDAAGFIKGNASVSSPNDGPTCKYAALFDSRPDFDHLRADFIQKEPRIFLQGLQSAMWKSGPDLAMVHNFVLKVQALCNCLLTPDRPADFAARAWPAYLQCVKKSAYWFTVEEVIILCARARVNVAIFIAEGDALTYEGGHFNGRGPVVFGKLCQNIQGRVRGHFERLVPELEAYQLLVAADRLKAEDITTTNQCDHACDLSKELSISTLKKKGYGTRSRSDCMNEMLTEVLAATPNMILLEDVAAEMYEVVKKRLVGWSCLELASTKRGEHYFNVAAVKCARTSDAETSTSYHFPDSSNGRDSCTMQRQGWAAGNTHAKPGPYARDFMTDAPHDGLTHAPQQVTTSLARKIGEEVLAWQALQGCQCIPNRRSHDGHEKTLGKRFHDVLRRRYCAIGVWPCQQQLSADDLHFINRIPGVPHRDCSANTVAPGTIEANVPIYTDAVQPDVGDIQDLQAQQKPVQGPAKRRRV